tara:strand:- start:2476 stop:3195 length:720 start_codon:yes stop_codon:yes gene_type:complete
MTRPWTHIPIFDSGEELLPIPNSIPRSDPHPYAVLGAPYGGDMNPWYLRSGVLDRLLKAQNYLKSIEPSLNLFLFDAWRPIVVQKFMINYTVNSMCSSKGIDKEDPESKIMLDKIINQVNQFWAPPSSDPKTPPPHSTGSAIDITISDKNSFFLDMGGEIDEIGPRSHPNYYLDNLSENKSYGLYNKRRILLRESMSKFDFVQHPNEWWHFSYGDQLWAWKSSSKIAIYGASSATLSNL